MTKKSRQKFKHRKRKELLRWNDLHTTEKIHVGKKLIYVVEMILNFNIYSEVCPRRRFHEFIVITQHIYIYPTYGSRYLNGLSKIFGRQLLKNLKWYGVCLGRPFYFKIFEGCFPQISLGSFLNTLTRISW